MIRSVMVPLDGSTFGEHALPLALAVARRAGATLRLAHVHQPLSPATIAGVAVMDNVELAIKKEELAYLGKMVNRLAPLVQEAVTPVLLDGDVAAALQAHAEATSTDLVVLATHGRGPLGRFWLGSVADELVRHLPMPILLVRPEKRPADLAVEPKIKKILLPLDGTPLAEQIIEPALDLAGLLGARVTLLRVIKPPILPAYIPEGVTLGDLTGSVLDQAEAQHKHLREEATAYLNAVAERLRTRALGVEAHVVVEEQAAVGVLCEARACNADLIALETHGRRGLSRLLLGSIADKVIRASHVPVLVHRPVQV